jgi:isopenicillin N synthase-like dioxygenase
MSALSEPHGSETSNSIFKSLKSYGGLVIENAPLTSNLIHRAIEAQTKVFQLPIENKNRYRSPDQLARTGYIPFSLEVSEPGRKPDPKELWHISRDSQVENIWPEEIPEFKKTGRELWAELDLFSTELMWVIGRSLGCEDYAQEIMLEHDSILRMIRYGENGSCGTTEELAGSHRDVGLFTIHVFKSHPGYEVQLEGEWGPVLANDNALIYISAGDMLTHISNGNFPSTLHRVKNLVGNKGHRYFTGFFVHPNPNAVLVSWPQNKEPSKFADRNSLEMLYRRAIDINISK